MHENNFYEDPEEEELVIALATDYAVENKDKFEFSDGYIEKLIKRTKISIEIDGRPIQEQMLSYYSSSNSDAMILQNNIQRVLDRIWGNKNIRNKFDESMDLIKMENLIEKQLAGYDDNISEEDVDNIILDLIMEY